MHPKVYNAFERICTERRVRGSVLEVGAVPNDTSLLTMKSLTKVREKIGINLDGPHRYHDFSIVQADANNMTCFEDVRFDAVLCNAVLEHDKFFWKTIAEMRRVTKSGGLMVIGAPGYRMFSIEKYLRIMFKRAPFISRYTETCLLTNSTVTFCVHNFPGDYYRFSPQVFTEVFFEGMHNVSVVSLMIPPRIIGSGIKP